MVNRRFVELTTFKNVMQKLCKALFGLVFGSLFFVGCYVNNPYQVSNKLSAPFDLTELTIEELMEVRFITILKKPGTVMESPGAIKSVPAGDIKRSGASSLPEALKMVAGLQVTQHNAGNWAVTARGFSGMSRNISGQFANKLLVLKDGRSLYTPLFSGVTWAGQDILLDDIERIEVVRGPGATLWGANAVNGVVNIVSKNAYETQGNFISVGLGTEKNKFLHLRHGDRIGINTFYRVYGKIYNHNNFSIDTDLPGADDSWDSYKTGFRMDSYHSQSVYTLQGEMAKTGINQVYNLTSFETASNQLVTSNDEYSDGHIIGKWNYQHSNQAESSMKIYFDRLKINEVAVKGVINTFDIEFQNRMNVSYDHEIIWGAGYRLVKDKFDSTFSFNLTPSGRQFHAANAFLQNENAFMNRRVFITLGSKFEVNDFTGFEIQPSLRFRFSPDETKTFWASVSRAVRTPSRGELDGNIALKGKKSPPIGGQSFNRFEFFRGSRQFESEKVLAFELGLRRRLGGRLSWDLATFYNRYNDLLSEQISLQVLVEAKSLFLNREPLNGMSGQTMGVEFSSEFKFGRDLDFRMVYSYLKMSLAPEQNKSLDIISKSIEKQSPAHLLNFMAFWDLGRNLNLNLSLRYVGEITGQNVAPFINGDSNLIWRINSKFEFSLVGQNLLKGNYYESSRILNAGDSENITRSLPSRVQRGFFTKLGLRF